MCDFLIQQHKKLLWSIKMTKCLHTSKFCIVQNVQIVNKTTPTRAKKICDINPLDMHQPLGSHVLLIAVQLGVVKGPSVITWFNCQVIFQLKFTVPTVLERIRGRSSPLSLKWSCYIHAADACAAQTTCSTERLFAFIRREICVSKEDLWSGSREQHRVGTSGAHRAEQQVRERWWHHSWMGQEY